MKILYILAALALGLAACMPAGELVPTLAPSLTPSPTPTRAERPKNAILTNPLAESSPSPTPSAACLVETGQPAGTVYIRSGPGMSWPVTGYATQGERLELTGRTDPAGWAEVRQESGLAGWFYILRWCAK